MKPQLKLKSLVLGFVLGSVTLILLGASAPHGIDTSSNRYQMELDGSFIFVLNKETGEVWRGTKSSPAQNFLWESLGTPRMPMVSSLESPLKAARRELAELRLRYKDKHPRILEQLAKIKALEKESRAATPDSPEIQEARTELAKLKLRYKDAHPAIQEQLGRIKALQEASVR